jgi:hypothetical protein
VPRRARGHPQTTMRLPPGSDHPATIPGVASGWSRPSRNDPGGRSRLVATIPERPPLSLQPGRKPSAPMPAPSFGVVQNLREHTPGQVRAGLQPPRHDLPARPSWLQTIRDRPRGSLRAGCKPFGIDPEGRFELVQTIRHRSRGAFRTGPNHSGSIRGHAPVWSKPFWIDPEVIPTWFKPTPSPAHPTTVP